MNTETENGTALIFDRSGQAMFPELTAGASEHLVRTSRLQENEQGLTETEAALSEKCSAFLANLKKKTDPNGLSTKMLRECCQAIAGGDFLSIILAMEELGYDISWQVFNSKYHGVPQNRERVYTLGHLRAFGERKVFPLRGAAEEDSVQRKINIIGHRDGYRRNTQTFDYNGITEALDTAAGGGREQHTAIPMFGIDYNVGGKEREIANCLTTRNVMSGITNVNQDGTAVCIPVLTPDRAEKRQNGRRFKDNGEEAFTLTSQDKHGVALGVFRTVRSEYGKAIRKEYESGNLDISRHTFLEYEIRQDGISNTIDSVQKDNILALKIREATVKGYAEAEIGNSVNLSMPESKTRRGRVGKKQANTLDTSCEQGVVVPVVWYEKYKCYIAIRKPTPRECFRLQGWTDDYFDKAQFVNSDSQLYKQAGNGVTVNVVEDIARAIKG